MLVQRTPYDKAFFPFTWVVLDPTKMAGAGYAVVICDVRGRFASEGEFYPYVNEARDGHDTIEWAAGQPWSDGNVGTYGVSYMGQSQWLAAATRPPSLRCIATATSPHDAHHDLVYRGGALSLGVLASWSMITIAPRELVRRAAGTTNFLADFLGLVDDIDAVDQPLRKLPLVPFAPLRRGGDGRSCRCSRRTSATRCATSRHEQMSSSRRHDRIQVPALQLAGWYDLCLQADLDHFTAMRKFAANGAGPPADPHPRRALGARGVRRRRRHGRLRDAGQRHPARPARRPDRAAPALVRRPAARAADRHRRRAAGEAVRDGAQPVAQRGRVAAAPGPHRELVPDGGAAG